MPPGNPWDRDYSGRWYVVWQSCGGKGKGGKQVQDVKPKPDPERRTMLACIEQYKTEWEDFQRAGQARANGDPAYVSMQVKVAWTCQVCRAWHHNLKKSTCRVCLAPRDVEDHA